MTQSPDTNTQPVDPIPWLLEPDNPCVRCMTLTDLLDRPAGDAEVAAARRSILTFEPVRRILDAQWPDGYWMHPGRGYSPKYKATVWQIIFLAAMGIFRCDQVARAIEYTLTHSRLPDGRFSARQDAQGAIPCLNGNLLRALIWFGYARDERVIKTRQALAAQVAQDNFRCRYNSPPGRRPSRMSGGLPCAWGAVKVLGALVALPAAQLMPQEKAASQQAIDLLLAHDLADGDYSTATEPSPLWRKFGFPLGFTADLLEALQVLLRAGIPANTPRLSAALSLMLEKQNEQGRWPLERTPGKTWTSFGPQAKSSKWITLRALRVLRYME